MCGDHCLEVTQNLEVTDHRTQIRNNKPKNKLYFNYTVFSCSDYRSVLLATTDSWIPSFQLPVWSESWESRGQCAKVTHYPKSPPYLLWSGPWSTLKLRFIVFFLMNGEISAVASITDPCNRQLQVVGCHPSRCRYDLRAGESVDPNPKAHRTKDLHHTCSGTACGAL